MSWQVLERIVRFVGKNAHVDIVIQKKDDESPFIYAIVDEKKDKALILHAHCDNLEQAKTMAMGSLLTYEAMHNVQNESNKLLVYEDGVIMVAIRTEFGDKYEPLAASGEIHMQVNNIVNSALDILKSDSNVE